MTRYLIGSIVGAACLFAIIKSGSPFGCKIDHFIEYALNGCSECSSCNFVEKIYLKNQIQSSAINNSTISPNYQIGNKCNESSSKASRLVLLLALGFGYCYLVSAPLTLLHYSRSLLNGCKNCNRANFWGWYYGINFVLLIFPFLGLLAAYTCGIWVIFILIFAAFLIPLFYFAHIHGFHFYSKKACLVSRDHAYYKQFKSSYRDLAEHGNAYMIVIYEVLWAYSLADRNMPIFPVIFLSMGWVFLGAICLVLARALELEMVYHNTLAKNEVKNTPKSQD